MGNLLFYFWAFALAFVLTAIFSPIFCHSFATILGDKPTTLKNHKGIVPLVGGLSIFIGFLVSLIFIRLNTNFPSGTLHNLRGILLGASIIFILGLIDDLRKPKGLSALLKLLFQIIASCCLIYFNVKIQFLPSPIAEILTILWVCGMTNAFNLLDIQDGLAGFQALLSASAFLIISLPSENIYVNFLAIALMGSVLGFLPYNFATKYKSFLGDSGSTLLGFLLSALALGTDYSANNTLAVFVPILILFFPLFDTCFVSVVRVSKKMSPLQGSADHFPLRLVRYGLTKKQVLFWVCLVSILLDCMAYFITITTMQNTIIIYSIFIILTLIFALFLRGK